jgi:hypothetical protein
MNVGEIPMRKFREGGSEGSATAEEDASLRSI